MIIKNWQMIAAVVGIPATAFAAIVQGKAAWDATEDGHLATHVFVREAVKTGVDSLSSQITIQTKALSDKLDDTAASAASRLNGLWAGVLKARIDGLNSSLTLERTQEISLQRMLDEDPSNDTVRLQLGYLRTSIDTNSRTLSSVTCDFDRILDLTRTC